MAPPAFVSANSDSTGVQKVGGATPRLPMYLARSVVPSSIKDRASEDGVSGVEWSGWGVIKGAIMALSKRPRNNNDDDDLNVGRQQHVIPRPRPHGGRPHRAYAHTFFFILKAKSIAFIVGTLSEAEPGLNSTLPD